MIDTPERLETLEAQAASSEWAAMDTEADSLHAYPEKLCLVQVSVAGADEIVDPLAGLDMAPLLATLRGREIILHGADYDLRLLYRTFQFVPERIFDTMWAARLLGIQEFGLNRLVSERLGVTLEKGPQTMNWARRPLTPRMETYARNDTRYLKPLADLLRAELERKGRLDWLRQTCQRVIHEAAQPRVLDENRVWRLKGSDRLTPFGLAILRRLWQWRENEAVAANRPPYFVLSHEALVALSSRLAQGAPADEASIRHVRGSRAQRLREAVQEALKTPPEEHPQRIRSVSPRLTQAVQDRFHQLKNRRDRGASALDLDPSLVASRGELYLWARDPANAERHLLPWQRQVIEAH